jgi:hypothetical protein
LKRGEVESRRWEENQLAEKWEGHLDSQKLAVRDLSRNNKDLGMQLILEEGQKLS